VGVLVLVLVLQLSASGVGVKMLLLACRPNGGFVSRVFCEGLCLCIPNVLLLLGKRQALACSWSLSAGWGQLLEIYRLSGLEDLDCLFLFARGWH
jgi:hypothetical protein